MASDSQHQQTMDHGGSDNGSYGVDTVGGVQRTPNAFWKVCFPENASAKLNIFSVVGRFGSRLFLLVFQSHVRKYNKVLGLLYNLMASFLWQTEGGWCQAHGYGKYFTRRRLFNESLSILTSYDSRQNGLSECTCLVSKKNAIE